MTDTDDRGRATPRGDWATVEGGAVRRAGPRVARGEPELPTQELLRRALERVRGPQDRVLCVGRGRCVLRGQRPSSASRGCRGVLAARLRAGRRSLRRRAQEARALLRLAPEVLALRRRRRSSRNEQVETIVRCLARDFVAFGGLPLMAVFDRPRTIVKKSGQGTRSRGVQRHLRAGDRRHRGRRRDVRAAERQPEGHGRAPREWVKSSFFKHRKFQDEADLQAQLAAWHVEVQHQDASRGDERDSGNAAPGGARRASDRSRCFRKSSRCAFPSSSDRPPR